MQLVVVVVVVVLVGGVVGVFGGTCFCGGGGVPENFLLLFLTFVSYVCFLRLFLTLFCFCRNAKGTFVDD